MNTNTNTLSSRWGKLCSLDGLAKLGEIADILGQPEVHTIDDIPKYAPGVFQVVLGEDGAYIHAALLRRWNRRQMAKFLAGCNEPSVYNRN